MKIQNLSFSHSESEIHHQLVMPTVKSAADIVHSVFKFIQYEQKHGIKISLDRVTERTAAMCGIAKSSICRYVCRNEH